MSHPDLQSFVTALRKSGELVEIETLCDPVLEIPEIHRRVIAAGGPALLFRNPRGAEFPLVTNLFGSKARVDQAFGNRPAEFVRRAVAIATGPELPGPATLWKNRDWVRQGLKLGFKHRARGLVTEVVDDPPMLDRLPMLKSWKDDGGAFITLPLVYTEHPDHGGHNLGMYRIQRYDDRTTGMHIQIHRGGGNHLAIAEARNETLPVTVFVGGPPALILSAIAPLPENVPELLLASLLVGGKLPRCDNPVGPHPLVATAEFALVGELRAHERRPEGPFGDHYGYYSLKHDYPVFHVKALCRRKQPIFPATVVGKPRQEDAYLGDYLQALLSPLFPVVMPSVSSLWTYGETGYHALGAVVTKERYPREAMVTAFRVLGEGQLSLTKFLLVTNAEVDLSDFPATLEATLARFRPETDLYVFSNLSMDTLDYSGPEVNKGSKGVMLGVGDPVRELQRHFQGTLPSGVDQPVVFCGGCLVLQGVAYTEEPNLPARVVEAAKAHESGLSSFQLIVVVDDSAVATRTTARFLWTTFTRFEPAADLHARTRVHRHHLVHEGPIVLDARLKPGYPAELFCDPDTAATVDKRWREYFPEGGVEMGNSDVADLG
jgi:UbiD family decarboxylase